jgi:hypothetical protein
MIVIIDTMMMMINATILQGVSFPFLHQFSSWGKTVFLYSVLHASDHAPSLHVLHRVAAAVLSVLLIFLKSSSFSIACFILLAISDFSTKNNVAIHIEVNGRSITARQFPKPFRSRGQLPLSD